MGIVQLGGAFFDNEMGGFADYLIDQWRAETGAPDDDADGCDEWMKKLTLKDFIIHGHLYGMTKYNEGFAKAASMVKGASNDNL